MTFKFGETIHLVPTQTTVTGTTDTLVGSVYITKGVITKVAAFLGEQAATHTATLTITRNTGGGTLQALTSSSAQAEVSATSVTVSNSDYYDLYLKTNNASGVAVLSAVRFEF